MTTRKKDMELSRPFSRRDFIKVSSAALAVSSLPLTNCTGHRKAENRKMILSFYVDDTSPEIAGPDAYRTFLEFCKTHGVHGESSLILGYNGESMADNPDPRETKFLEFMQKSDEYGIDNHMEIMTHHELFDFDHRKIHESGIHEGLWLHEPGITEEEYLRYFTDILDNAHRAGVHFSGLTWPGCGCDACTARYDALRAEGSLKFNPAVWNALIRLCLQDRFRTKVIPIFYDASETSFGIFKRASDGEYGIYDLMPNAMDHFGIWENNPDRVDPDYYISEDGKTGIIVNHLDAGDPYCIWYSHWQGLNPENGVGWEAFRTVIERIEKNLSGRITWMRPSDIVTKYHEAGGWDFIEEL